MNDPGSGAIAVNDAKAIVAHWDSVRNDSTTVNDLFGEGFFFKIGSDFDSSQFDGHIFAHAYFALNISETPGTEDLSLLFITEQDDIDHSEDPTTTPYIYKAPYVNHGESLILPPVIAEELMAHWRTHGSTWVENRGANEEMTQASLVPLPGLMEHLNNGQDIYVHIGLRELPDPRLDLALLFYDTNSNNFIDLKISEFPDDFTSPKPPFGKKKNYSLLPASAE